FSLDDKKFHNSAEAQKYLTKNSDKNILSMINHLKRFQEVWQKLPEAVKTGRPAKQKAWTLGPHELLYGLEEMQRENPNCFDFLKKYFTERKELHALDVGAGTGHYSKKFAQTLNCKVTSLELETNFSVLEKKTKTEKRITAVKENFFNWETKEKFDIVFFADVLHGRGSNNSRIMLRKAAKLLNPEGIVVILEWLSDKSEMGAMFNLNMLLLTELGESFSLEEMKKILKESKLEFVEEVTDKLLPEKSFIVAKLNRGAAREAE
ncbi:MAG: class I SAM-dependent methyltransferase, partial [Candidatus Diapherotrites archaeon]|nr:class I SAM-dependent methyltransferase [Candidatus Diapherotrites archaeon]